MNTLKLPNVRKGEKIRVSQWDALGEAVRALRPVAGKGLTARQTNNGTIISTRRQTNRNQTAFRSRIEGAFVAIGPGFVNGTAPDGESKVRISTKSKLSWVVIDCEMDGDKLASWKFASVEKLGASATHPIALIDSRNGPAKLHQLTHFNLQILPKALPNGTLRFYFLPQ